MQVLLFTDGGARGNGYKHVKASFSVIQYNEIEKKYVTLTSGLVEPYEYELVNNVVKPDSSKSHMPSNNRAELLGVIHALLSLCDNVDTNVAIYSDSLILVNTVNIWYPNRLRNKTISKFENLDLINIMMNLYNKIKEKRNINIIHCRGHKKDIDGNTEAEKIIIGGNNMADKVVNDVMDNIN